MDTVLQVQRAIDYIEANLTETLRTEDIAARAMMSASHFQRIFSILCDLTLGEYIRYRRLTLAGLELQESKGKVIDAALKYGYESPESFSRAFTQFHGVTPAAARSRRCALRSLSAISIQSVYERKVDMIEKINERGYTFTEHAIPVYYTKDMDKTVGWFDEVLGWYAAVVARDENGAGTYGCAGSFPGELVHAGIRDADGIFFFPGEPVQTRIAWVNVSSVDKLHEFVKKSGWAQLTEVSPPQPWGGKTCTVTTIDGYTILFNEIA
jgi:AraC family transcriptional regulator